jgi:hypothetical protein
MYPVDQDQTIHGGLQCICRRSRDSQNGRITAFWGCIAKWVNIMAIIDITQKIGPASGEEAAVIAIPPALSKSSSATIWWGGHGRRIALVGGAAEGVLTLSTTLMEEMMGDGC